MPAISTELQWCLRVCVISDINIWQICHLLTVKNSELKAEVHKEVITQMTSSKKILKKRFIMISNKKKTSKIMSIISAIIATAMLVTTVFASGALSDLTTDDYTIEITNNGEKIELVNKPFIENDQVYVPLRELFGKAVSEDEGITDIKWNNGTINVIAAYYQGESGAYQFKINGNYMKVKHINFKEIENVFFDTNGDMIFIGLRGAPLLLHSTTYVTIEDMNYMLYGFTNRQDADKKTVELTYHIYDKSGNEISSEPFSDEEVAAAKVVIEEYYRAGNAKDRPAQLATLTQWHNAPNVLLSSDDKSIVTIKDIRYSPSDSRKAAEDYVKYGMGSVNGTKPENVIVFYIDYDVSFPENTSEQEKGAWMSSYDNWSMILIRDSKDGKWLIDDQGY